MDLNKLKIAIAWCDPYRATPADFQRLARHALDIRACATKLSDEAMANACLARISQLVDMRNRPVDPHTTYAFEGGRQR